MIKKTILVLIMFYRKILTLFSFGSCRYYPTCSQYSMQHFETNGLIKAFYFTIIRILKCNQLFKGGFDYPIVKCKLQNIMFKKINVKYWYVSVDLNKYKIIKNWNFKHE